jgi:hypothetical protein
VGDEAFITRFRPHRAHASREVPRHEGRRALETIFRDAVTREARNDAVVTAFRERYAVTEIARFLELHRTTVSKIVSEQGVRA